jgi:hypothetical protein
LQERHALLLYLANIPYLVPLATNGIEELDLLGHVEGDGIRCERERVLDQRVISYLQPDGCVYDLCSERGGDWL